MIDKFLRASACDAEVLELFVPIFRVHVVAFSQIIGRIWYIISPTVAPGKILILIM